MRELRQHHPVAALLKAAGLVRSTFYYQLGTLNVDDRHADLKAKIRAVFDHHKGRYGYRRVTAAIRQTGHLVNHKAVQRLMQQLQLKSLVHPKKYRSWRGEVGKAAPNLLQRQFSAAQANQKWVTDVTEFNVDGQKLYLSPMMDLYNGEIVAYQMDRRPSFELVTSMLKKALTKLKRTDRPLLHSDQGWQISNAGVSPAIEATLAHSKQVPQGELPRQCCDGKLLRHAQVRVLQGTSLHLRGAFVRHARSLHPLL